MPVGRLGHAAANTGVHNKKQVEGARAGRVGSFSSQSDRCDQQNNYYKSRCCTDELPNELLLN